MPQVRQTGIRAGGVRFTVTIRKALKTHQTGGPAVPSRTFGSTMNALAVARQSPFTLTNLVRNGAVWIRSLQRCDNLLALYHGQRSKVHKIMPKKSLYLRHKSLITNKT